MKKRQTDHCAVLSVLFAALLFADVSFGHQQWLSPNFTFQAGESAWLTFDHTFGDQRFLPGSGPGSYYTWWIVGPDGLKRSLSHLSIGKTRTVGEIEVTEPGTYRLEAIEDELPWTQLKIDDKNTWQPGTRRDFKGFDVTRSRVYFNKAVSYVTLESMTSGALGSTGEPLEIVFENHPNDLRPGQNIRIQVLASGKPLKEQTVQLFSQESEGHDPSSTLVTDKKGFCEFQVSAPGRYLLATNAEGDNPKRAGTDDYYHGYAVLIEVRAAEATTD